MRILVDADACPVKNIIVKVAKEYSIPVLMFMDTSHMLNDGYSQTIIVDQGRDSVDLAMANAIHAHDLAVTQDYGLASMLLAKKAYVFNQNGFMYTTDNIDRLLFERHLSQKVRRSGGKSSHIKKRTKEDDEKFEKVFRKMCENIVKDLQIP